MSHNETKIPERELSPKSVVDPKNPNNTMKADIYNGTSSIDENVLKTLNPQEAKLYKMYGKLPNKKDLIHRKLQERKYFDSGDYALSKANGGDGVKYQHFNNLPLTNPSGLRESIIKRRMSNGSPNEDGGSVSNNEGHGRPSIPLSPPSGDSPVLVSQNSTSSVKSSVSSNLNPHPSSISGSNVLGGNSITKAPAIPVVPAAPVVPTIPSGSSRSSSLRSSVSGSSLKMQHSKSNSITSNRSLSGYSTDTPRSSPGNSPLALSQLRSPPLNSNDSLNSLSSLNSLDSNTNDSNDSNDFDNSTYIEKSNPNSSHQSIDTGSDNVHNIKKTNSTSANTPLSQSISVSHDKDSHTTTTTERDYNSPTGLMSESSKTKTTTDYFAPKDHHE
ncbi:hypothetical protein ACO0RG_001128 [Hanseniaspora osmophila]|uniref:mRNA stability protein n=1 Tax=Hanseniaspora osmophila TaxID=56408 RepID=A0A1E5RNN6_9ASCO|nr:mRNA stability protein IGO2 [Hanseniaspora osmophila]